MTDLDKDELESKRDNVKGNKSGWILIPPDGGVSLKCPEYGARANSRGAEMSELTGIWRQEGIATASPMAASHSIGAPTAAEPPRCDRLTLSAALRAHWPEYLMEAALLGLFMASACGFGALLEYPGSPVHQSMPDAFLRRALMGVAMGTTAVALIYSSWGKCSGAHFNPATTLTFFRLGKIERADAIFYVLSQFAGGIAGVLLARVLLGTAVAHPMVNFVATTPGEFGSWAAFAAEVGIAFLLMTVILNVSNARQMAQWTGVFAGALVATYITFEAPISGMSLNPARTFGSAIWANAWMSLWIYFTAPVLGMLLAAQVYTKRRGVRGVRCAKLHHQNSQRCIFRCGYAEAEKANEGIPLRGWGQG